MIEAIVATFGWAFSIVLMFVAYAYFATHPGNRNRKRSLITLCAWLLLVAPASAQLYNASPQVNQQRMARGLYPLVERSDLQLAAERSVRLQAQHGMGHQGAMLSGTAEGVGSGSRDPLARRFRTCFHRNGDYTRSHRYFGAAVLTVGNRTYYAIELDNNSSAGGPVGRGHSQSSRRGRRFFRRMR